jgi:hypothetical protein
VSGVESNVVGSLVVAAIERVRTAVDLVEGIIKVEGMRRQSHSLWSKAEHPVRLGRTRYIPIRKIRRQRSLLNSVGTFSDGWLH